MKKGFAFIFDGILAIIILIAFISLALSIINEKELNEGKTLNKMILADDALEALQKDGTLMQGNLTQIKLKLNELIPNFEWKAEIKKYSFNQITQDFELKEIKTIGTEESLENTVQVKRFWLTFNENNVSAYYEINLEVQ